jgi:hypothetical protein
VESVPGKNAGASCWSLLKKPFLRRRLAPLLAGPAVFPAEIVALLDKPAVVPAFFSRLRWSCG